MKPSLIKCRRLHSLTIFKQSVDNEPKRKIFTRKPWKLGRKAKSIVAIAIIAIMLVSVFAWLSTGTQNEPKIIQPINNSTASPSPTSQQTATPTKTPGGTSDLGQFINHAALSLTEIITQTRAPGLIESNQNVNSTVWKTVAANAWKCFQPGIGVDSNTGLPKGTLDYPYFTDWDLGAYIQAVIDANKTGLIGNSGDWGSTARLEKVVTFLETRKLNSSYGYPFWVYQAANGENYKKQSDLATGQVDAVDTGRLFVALYNLKTFNPSFSSRIDNLVYNVYDNRSDYAALVPSVQADSSNSTSVYSYYLASGFASFWPTELSGATAKILNNIQNAGTTTDGLYGVSLPKATISCEPLLSSVFDLNYDPNLMALANRVYLAHEAKYNATGEYVAFSEGNDNLNFIYEWVVLPSGETWKVMKAGENTYSNIKPIIYTKIALSFLALYNTTFARNMAIYLEKSLADPTNGYAQGADFNTDTNSANLVVSISSNTNAMILSAARYAIQNNPQHIA